MNWTDQAWSEIDSIYNDIINMPFVKQLSEGSLEKEKFQFYMQQDALYLAGYGRVLAAIGAKAEDNQMALDFFEFGKTALIVESALHQSYFEKFGLSSSQPNRIEPACHHYLSHLKACFAFQAIEVAAAAVLPCFWIYKEVGDHIYKTGIRENNPYSAWIETYSGEDFAQGVIKAKSYCDQLAAQCTEKTRQQMTEAFIISSHMEYQFWDAAYRQRCWEDR